MEGFFKSLQAVKLDNVFNPWFCRDEDNDIDFDFNIKEEIKMKIRNYCSPKHVPSIVLSVQDIPYTMNGKKVEVAVKKIINGFEVDNKESLANPESLELFKNIEELYI